MIEKTDEQLQKEIDFAIELSYLEFSEKDKEKIVDDVKNTILRFAGQIETIDTSNVQLTKKIIAFDDLRKDEPVTAFSQNDALLNAPQRELNCFSVPKMQE